MKKTKYEGSNVVLQLSGGIEVTIPVAILLSASFDTEGSEIVKPNNNQTKTGRRNKAWGDYTKNQCFEAFHEVLNCGKKCTPKQVKLKLEERGVTEIPPDSTLSTWISSWREDSESSSDEDDTSDLKDFVVRDQDDNRTDKEYYQDQSLLRGDTDKIKALKHASETIVVDEEVDE